MRIVTSKRYGEGRVDQAEIHFPNYVVSMWALKQNGNGNPHPELRDCPIPSENVTITN